MVYINYILDINNILDIKKQKHGLNLKKRHWFITSNLRWSLPMIITDVSFRSIDIDFMKYEWKRG